jgi:exosortase C (VPDSG-CTERM-specific)
MVGVHAGYRLWQEHFPMQLGHSPVLPMKGFSEIPPRFRGLILVTVGLLVCFSLPLYALVRFAIPNELYSYIVLIPFIAGYLVWQRRRALPPFSGPDWKSAAVLLAIGTGLLAGYWIAGRSGMELGTEDCLALTTLAFLMFFGSACGLFLGRRTFRALAFPLGFLVFMTPIPILLQTWIETLLQYGSAAVAFGLFKLSGTPVLFRGLSFMLPGFSMQVAPQCSGIHSSLALIIISLLAGHIFLRSRWRRATLVLVVIPLALLRNGFRVFTIGQLCVHIGPEMINSYIHRHGGPLFFVLSLVPFFILLFFLIRMDGGIRHPASQKCRSLKCKISSV